MYYNTFISVEHARNDLKRDSCSLDLCFLAVFEFDFIYISFITELSKYSQSLLFIDFFANGTLAVN